MLRDESAGLDSDLIQIIISELQFHHYECESYFYSNFMMTKESDSAHLSLLSQSQNTIKHTQFFSHHLDKCFCLISSTHCLCVNVCVCVLRDSDLCVIYTRTDRPALVGCD